MADRGAMPSRPNPIQTPRARRPGKNISGFYQKKNGSQLIVRKVERKSERRWRVWVASPSGEGEGEGLGENECVHLESLTLILCPYAWGEARITKQRIEIRPIFDTVAQACSSR